MVNPRVDLIFDRTGQWLQRASQHGTPTELSFLGFVLHRSVVLGSMLTRKALEGFSLMIF